MPKESINGVLADHQLFDLLERQAITSFNRELVQPASLDLAVTGNVCEIAALPSIGGEQGFQPSQFRERFSRNCFDITKQSATLSPGSIYIAELSGAFSLPSTVYGYANPKSSTGRIDVHCTLVAEGSHAFNTVPRGYTGKLYLLIVPQSFPIVLHEGDSLMQLRLFQGERRFLTPHQMAGEQKEYTIVCNPGSKEPFVENGLILHIDLRGVPSNLVAQTNGRPIDLANRQQDPSGYFTEKPLYEGDLFLEPNQFLLATTVESVRVPPHLCAEMLPFREEYGELRTHYAGFFDPGFGYGSSGEVPHASVVCEIRNIGKAPIMLSHGQPIGLLRYEQVIASPTRVYGSSALSTTSNYQQQSGIKLAKYFAPWPN